MSRKLRSFSGLFAHRLDLLQESQSKGLDPQVPQGLQRSPVDYSAPVRSTATAVAVGAGRSSPRSRRISAGASIPNLTRPARISNRRIETPKPGNTISSFSRRERTSMANSFYTRAARGSRSSLHLEFTNSMSNAASQSLLNGIPAVFLPITTCSETADNRPPRSAREANGDSLQRHLGDLNIEDCVDAFAEHGTPRFLKRVVRLDTAEAARFGTRAAFRRVNGLASGRRPISTIGDTARPSPSVLLRIFCPQRWAIDGERNESASAAPQRPGHCTRRATFFRWLPSREPFLPEDATSNNEKNSHAKTQRRKDFWRESNFKARTANKGIAATGPVDKRSKPSRIKRARCIARRLFFASLRLGVSHSFLFRCFERGAQKTGPERFRAGAL